MSKIKFCALGGLGENGKNMYILEVDEKIFILDAGLKFPSVNLYGVDSVVPDISYLLENKKRVQGVFLSHGHDENIGAVPEILKRMDVGVFGSHFTISLVELELAEAGLDVKNYRLYRMSDEKVLRFGNISVSFYRTTHSIPESFGIAIKTSDGAIVYAPDFTFASTNDDKYKTSYGKLLDIAKDGVLALLSESLGTSTINRVDNDYTLNHVVNDFLMHSKRVIFSMYSSDLDRIQKVINLSVSNNRRVAVIGRKVQKIINIAMMTGYLKIPSENLVNLKFLDDNNTNEDEDLVVIVTGNRHEPFFGLQRMALGQDRLIKLNENDNVVIISPPVFGTERIAANCFDLINEIGCKITNIQKSSLKSSHADSEDLKMLYQMLNPKYIIPIIGEYRHQYMQRNVALEFNYDSNKIIMLDNGEQITFENGNLEDYKNKISVGDVLVDGSIIGDINEVVLHDREMLSQDGAIIVSAALDIVKKKVVSEPVIEMKGFILNNNGNELSKEMIDLVNKELLKISTSKKVDLTAIRNNIKDSITKFISKNTGKEPVVVPAIVDINEEEKL